MQTRNIYRIFTKKTQEMNVEAIKKHLKETPLDVLREEWRQVEKFANVGPLAMDYARIWNVPYDEPPCFNSDNIGKECKTNKNTKTPNKQFGVFA